MATTMATPDASALVLSVSRNPAQFQSLFNVIQFTFTFDDNSIANANSTVADLAVIGAAVGDFVLIAPSIDLVSVTATGWVRAADSVTVCFQNLEEVDANTTLNGNATYNGLILSPRSAWGIVD